MSDSAASLRRKIASAGDLESVVRTMKAMAASSIGQYENAVRALDDYYRTVQLGLAASFRQGASAGASTRMSQQSVIYIHLYMTYHFVKNILNIIVMSYLG